LTRKAFARWIPLALAALVAALWLAPPARTQAQKHLTVYAPAAVYSVPIVSYEGQDYIGLADILEPLGTVDARQDGSKWKLRFTPAGGREVNVEFQDGKQKGKIHGQDVQLPTNFHMENGRGYVPLHILGPLLPLLEGTMPVDFREASLRLFLGNVQVKYTQELQKGSTPKLVFSFSAPVNPMVATEPGKLRLVFRREAVVSPASGNLAASDPVITGAVFSDAGGTAQIAVNGSVPLNATFSDGNKTITITPAPGAVPPTETAKAQAPPLAPTTAPPTAAPALPPPGPAVPTGPRFVVVIDPAHGGDERGAAINDAIKEKDVNLALARRLQHELQNKGIAATLLRSGDTTIAVDDRAIATNAAHPALYLCVHAANLGTGLRIFTALMSPSGVTTHTFLPWPQAQAPYLDLSSQFAGSISAELSNRQIPVTALPAPLRPMRNIAAAAIAIEIAPPDDDVKNINSAEYQQNIVAAVANGIAAMKPKMQGAK
jgi:N-acetylmuramoyl-L-alanine amidase